jgi:hypothetical protein
MLRSSWHYGLTLVFSVCSCFAACRVFSHCFALACLRRAFVKCSVHGFTPRLTHSMPIRITKPPSVFAIRGAISPSNDPGLELPIPSFRFGSAALTPAFRYSTAPRYTDATRRFMLRSRKRGPKLWPRSLVSNVRSMVANEIGDPSGGIGQCKLFHVIGPPLVIAAVKHVWHAAGREGADGHPFPASAHVDELARAVNDTPRPFGLGRISLPGIHAKELVAGRVHELAADRPRSLLVYRGIALGSEPSSLIARNQALTPGHMMAQHGCASLSRFGRGPSAYNLRHF